MNQRIVDLITKITLRGAGKIKHQKFYESLLNVALKGMNIGVGSEVESSGEMAVLEYVKKKTLRITRPLVIFDVGANLGKYTSLLLKTFQGRKTKIFSFEPSKKTFSELQINCQNEKVELNNFGFGKENTQVNIYYDAETSGIASIYQRRLDHFGIKMNKKEEIKLRTVDDFCEENGIKKIDFLKLDVEGNEYSVLEGAKKMLEKKAIRFIQFEFGGCNIDSRTFFQDFYYILKDNYRIYRIVNDGISEIKEYREIYELFTTTNFLAERRAL